VGGPFDLAYTRLFLMHQPDPVRTLSQIARLLRPGGWVVAQEALRSPPPRSHPHLDALGAYWDLVYQVLERAGGVPHGAVDGLAGSARAEGLDVVAVDGSFGIIDPELGFDLHAATLLAARERAVASGIATGQQIDDLAGDLRAAKSGGYHRRTGAHRHDYVLLGAGLDTFAWRHRKPAGSVSGRSTTRRPSAGSAGRWLSASSVSPRTSASFLWT